MNAVKEAHDPYVVAAFFTHFTEDCLFDVLAEFHAAAGELPFFMISRIARIIAQVEKNQSIAYNDRERNNILFMTELMRILLRLNERLAALTYRVFFRDRKFGK